MPDIDIRQGQQIDLDIGRVSDPIDLRLNSNTRNIDLDIQHCSGVSDYNYLTGKPKINGVTVVGEKLGQDYKLQNQMDILQDSEIDTIIYGG